MFSIYDQRLFRQMVERGKKIIKVCYLRNHGMGRMNMKMKGKRQNQSKSFSVGHGFGLMHRQNCAKPHLGSSGGVLMEKEMWGRRTKP